VSPDPLRGEVLDLFCGGGGASAGLEAALGRPVTLAVDWDADALAIHRDNHPEARHVLADVSALNPRDLAHPGGVDLMWASPPCTGFSRARTRTAAAPGVADLPWEVVRWAGALRPRLVIVENVEDMLGWGSG
jgi:DNA (cytosine-5)-methyltransferase 1